jgi:hypothetical protein
VRAIFETRGPKSPNTVKARADSAFAEDAAVLAGEFSHPLLAMLAIASRMVQGVPPAGAKDWMRIYDDAGCEFNDAVQIQNLGIRTFIHQVRFPPFKPANRPG